MAGAHSEQMLLVPRRLLVELYDAALEIREKVDEANRLRIDLESRFRRFEALIDTAIPGLVLERSLSRDETTPVEVPRR
jgi:hypothetical protein